jgi:hypothetical protein
VKVASINKPIENNMTKGNEKSLKKSPAKNLKEKRSDKAHKREEKKHESPVPELNRNTKK